MSVNTIKLLKNDITRKKLNLVKPGPYGGSKTSEWDSEILGMSNHLITFLKFCSFSIVDIMPLKAFS